MLKLDCVILIVEIYVGFMFVWYKLIVIYVFIFDVYIFVY